MPKKRVRINYRRYYRTSEPAILVSLAAALTDYLKSISGDIVINDSVALRTFHDEVYGSVILNGRMMSQNGDFFGELVRYDPDANIPLLMQSSDRLDELEIREANKPNDSELLRGMAFFYVTKDHFFIIEQNVSNSCVESYLQWIICHRTKNGNQKKRIQLIPKIINADDKLRDVTEIKFRPRAASPNELTFHKEKSVASDNETGLASNIIKILKAAHFDTAIIEKVAAAENASVELKMDLVLRAGRSRVKISGNDALAALRDVPMEELIIEGTGIRKNRGAIEKLTDWVDIERKGNILDRRAAWQALRQAAINYRGSGLIE